MYWYRISQISLIFVMLITFWSAFGAPEAAAAPIKILSNSRHAYTTITSTITQLLGRPYTSAEFIVHSTSMNSEFAGDATQAISSVSRYDESGVLVPSQAPYQLYTSSFTGYQGDTATAYDLSVTYDLTHNYASTASTNSPPPAFYTAPGGDGFASVSGVEWTLDPALFCSSTLSCLTAANAGIMAVLRFNHPTWNWFDVKGALRQTGTMWATGYNSLLYGYGQVNYATANALTDSQIVLQPPHAVGSVVSDRIRFTLYPFKQTRRVKEVLFQFSSAPAFQAGELTLSAIQGLGGTKVTEYSGVAAATLTPLYVTTTNAYFVWFTADNTEDSAAKFSRIDTYSVLGPLSQPETSFNGDFDIIAPAANAITTATSPTFSWTAAESYFGITKYQLYIDGVLNRDNLTSTTATPATPLSPGSHTWFIRAVNGNGVTADSVSAPTLNVNPNYVTGATFYVDNVLGDDNNVGTQTDPWATLVKAQETAVAGNTVILIKNEGQPYREALIPVNVGTSEAPITFRGRDTNTKPEIWGSADMSGGWTVSAGGTSGTYQKASTNQSSVLVAGPALNSLAKKKRGASATTLNPGEWFWSSGTLYYRVASGEDISTLRIEASVRDYGISGVGYQVFQDIVVRYANLAGMYLTGTGALAQNIEAHDSYTGIQLDFNSQSTLNYCVATGNTEYGISSMYAKNTTLNNCLLYGNGLSGGNFNILSSGITITLKNSVAAGNGTTSFSFRYFFGTPIFIATNNAWDIAGDSYWETYKGSNNQESVNSRFINPSERNFSLQSLSPNIDGGTPIAGLTADILGNPIYGTPDIGAYEYQPPYMIGTDAIPLSSSVRVYGDEKFRRLAVPADETGANLSVALPGNDTTQWLDIAITTWEKTGDYRKVWTESSSVSGLTDTVHTLGDLAANTYYNVKVDGVLGNDVSGPNCTNGVCLSNAIGEISFTYGGSYSTHTFEVSPGDNGVPALFDGRPVGTLHNDTDQVALTLQTTETSTCRYAVTAGTAYATMPFVFETTGRTTHSTPIRNLRPGERYTYFVRCQDTTGNIAETDYVISFKVAPDELATELPMDSPRIRGSLVAKRLPRGETLYFTQSRFFLSGRDKEFVQGRVAVFEGSKKIATAEVNDEGRWKTDFLKRAPGSYEFRFRYNDDNGTIVSEQTRKVVVDVEPPRFVSFPTAFGSFQRGETPLFWEAVDNEKLGKYTIFFGGKTYLQEAGSFLLPPQAPLGWQTFRVRATDMAGQSVERALQIFVVPGEEK